MMSEDLSLKHKDFVSNSLKSLNNNLSEYSFSNLFLFRNIHKYAIDSEKSNFISGFTYDKMKYIMPLHDVSQIGIDVIYNHLSNYDFIFPIDKSAIDQFQVHDFFNISYCDDDSDYIYSCRSLSELKGHELCRHRGIVRQFNKEHSVYINEICKSVKNEIINILDSWQERSNTPKGINDYYPCLDAVKYFEDLSLSGFLYYVDDKPAGFQIGEQLNENTYVIHFSKAINKIIGLNQFMLHSISSNFHYSKSYNYINYEQDLGINSLRYYKKSYCPINILKKYRVNRKK